MRSRYPPLLIVSLSVCFVTNVLHGGVVIQHFGASDPETAGFTLSGSGTAELGPVFGDFGRDAWSIRTPSGPESASYHYNLSLEEQQDAALHGWELSATIRLVEGHDIGGTRLRYLGSTAGYALSFSVNTEGFLLVEAAPFQQYLIEGDPYSYHQYSIRFDPLDKLASLWIDGEKRADDLFAYSGSSMPMLTFGAGQAITHSHLNEVSFTIIPEPATMALLSGIGALLCVGGMRWRMGQTRERTGCDR